MKLVLNFLFTIITFFGLALIYKPARYKSKNTSILLRPTVILGCAENCINN